MICKLQVCWHRVHSLCTWARRIAGHLWEDWGDICRRTRQWICKKEQTHWRYKGQRRSFSKHSLSATRRKAEHKVPSSSGVIVQFWIHVVALNGLEIPHSLDLFAVITASTGMVALKSCSTGKWQYLPGCLCWVLQLPSATLSCWH